MAQRSTSTAKRLRLLARRYGIAGKVPVLVAGLVVIVVACVVGIVSFSPGNAMTIERGEQSAVSEQTAAEGSESAAQATEQVASEVSGSADKSAAEGQGDSAGGATGALPTARVVVHVDGAVKSPGVYEVTVSDPRVNDVVALAGGLAAKADTSLVNLAAPVADGDKVHIPEVGEQDAAVSQSGAQGGQSGAAGEASSAGSQDTASVGTQDGSAAGSSGSTGQGLVNINTATAEELQSLPGVGEATSAAIVEDREANGPFASPEDLMRVSGIGEKKFAKMEGLVCV